MTINHLGGIFGRNPTFNDVTIEGTLTFDGDIDISSDLKVDGDLVVTGNVGIGTSSPDAKLDINGNAQIVAATGSGTLNLVSSENVLNAGQKIAFFGANRNTTDEEHAYIKSLMTSNNGGAGNVQLGHLSFGTSGNERVRIDSDGNVGIGTDSPSSNLHVREGSTSNLPTINVATKGILESTSSATAFCGLSIIAGATSGASVLNFGDSDDEDVGRILYSHADNSLRMNTSASEAMRITSGGHLLVGKTDQDSTNTVGFEAKNTGEIGVTTDGTAAGYFNRKTSDGTIAEFRKDNGTVGTISAASTNVIYGNDTRGIKIEDALIIPRDVDDTTADSQMDLGSSTSRFKDLYLSGGAYLGGTAAANKLDDYEEGTFTPVVADASTGGNTATGTFTGRYTKIGNLVCVQIVLTNINTTGLTAGNQLFVRDLPFTSVGGNFTNSAPYTNNVTFSGYLTSIFGASRTFLYFQDNNSGSGNTNLIVSEINSGVSDIALTTFYEAA